MKKLTCATCGINTVYFTKSSFSRKRQELSLMFTCLDGHNSKLYMSAAFGTVDFMSLIVLDK